MDGRQSQLAWTGASWWSRPVPGAIWRAKRRTVTDIEWLRCVDPGFLSFGPFGRHVRWSDDCEARMHSLGLRPRNALLDVA
jgi:hypothetical protein